ncbi:MAG: protein translocase subunit SecD [Actinobacteria bacterium]|nr:protein translocase subunit SecD [Actinomycetota bacterium]
MAPPTTPTPRPWRYLAALGALLVVLVLGVLGGNIGNPSNWHKSFVVGRGLDLSSGTSITLQAVTTKQPGQQHPPPPSPQAMAKAVQIITNRVEATGLTGASVVPQGTNEIVVSAPGAGAQSLSRLVGETALLRLRQVLYEAPNRVSSATPSAPASPSPASPSSAPSSSGAPKASASPTPSAGSGQAVGASKVGAAASASPSAAASPSTAASPAASPSASAGQPGRLATTADGAGDAQALTPATVQLFDKLNCDAKNWKTQIYGENPNAWDNPKVQTVACLGGNKWAMAPAVVEGKDLTNVKAQLQQTQGWVVTFNVRNPAAGKLGTLTTTMVNQYYNASSGQATSPLDYLAVVLDGDLQGSPPQVTGAISTSGQINGGNAGFSQNQANQLANVLKFGSLPLSFHNLFTSSVSPSLGSDQLSAGLTAAVVGLLLVVVYSFIYYRGLGIVSVLSLSIAAALSYLAVVLLSAHEGFTLSLAGIAGLIVAIGITADSFIIYFERLRDEVREGRSLRAAVERGWNRARRTILVSDTVSFLAALLLYILSAGDVRGFAFTLGLTTLIDVVVVFLFTKPMISLLARTKFYGQGHRLSGLDPARLGSRAPWRGGRRPEPGAVTGAAATTTPREA